MQPRTIIFFCLVLTLIWFSFHNVDDLHNETVPPHPETSKSFHLPQKVSSIWQTRIPQYQLDCDPQNDYFSVLEGHNWNKWMAISHSMKESYESNTKPRVPCNNYWHTGRNACPKLPFSKAYNNQSMTNFCNIVLDNGYERGRAIPRKYSRMEGFPHLDSSASDPLSRDMSGSVKTVSLWKVDYPLKSIGGGVILNELSTLQLLNIISKSGEMNSFAVNLGANDGATSDPVAELYHHGWQGVAVELEAGFCDKLETNLGNTDVTIYCPLPATPFNIGSLLKGAPYDMDYLKIDIDSYDCDVLAAILATGFRPKVIQMETGTIPPPIRFASHYSDRFTRPHPQIFQAFGCSLSYANDLLQSFDHYDLIEASLDSIWVRRDILESATKTTNSLRSSSPISALDPLAAYVNGFWRYPWRRELHIWEIGTEHWFQLRKDEHRLAAISDHMSCVDSCFHSDRTPFDYTLQLKQLSPPFKGSSPSTDFPSSSSTSR